MLVLCLRTDKPEAELYVCEDDQSVASLVWEAHRELAETIHQKVRELLNSQAKNFQDLQGLAVYQGPGSFTGLRIGISVANALAGALDVPIVGSTGERWLTVALQQLAQGENSHQVVPIYGSPPHVTAPKR